MARRRKSGRRGLFNKRLTPDEQAAQRDAAFDAIRRLYGEALPLWRLCQSGYCRRHQVCIGDVRSCLDRNWPHMAPELQTRAHHTVMRGGPRRRRRHTRNGNCGVSRRRTSSVTEFAARNETNGSGPKWPAQ
jgi:hypothetical protein